MGLSWGATEKEKSHQQQQQRIQELKDF